MNVHDLYLRKSGDGYVDTGSEYYYECEDGFFVLDPREDALWIVQLGGDAKRLMRRVELIALRAGYDTIKAMTKRNPKAMARAHGAELIGYVIQRKIGAAHE